ncbi:MAG: alanine--tRNA ligase [Phycisphaerales bacterium]|nr:alanine--tRNA ligase [Phycisphaerales bacterium]
MPLTSAQVRQQFIDFFVKEHAHMFVPSSPVVPHEDPTLLFANAGMNQFKPYFLGAAASPREWGGRVANTQKCIRAGGKHNDLDDVGRSRRHHTFFEMLGNWSFGNYFKQGAIEMAWELLTKVFGLDPRILHVSCYEGAPGILKDTEASDIWRKVANWEQYGLRSDDHIHYFGKDNFWEMGDTGPCGPCTEIYIDRRPEAEIEAERAAKRRAPVNGDDPRVMEIWNLVFIQYNRDASGKLTTLPAQHVDTGMGLERLCQVLQGKDDNYATDLFTPIFDEIGKLSGRKYAGQFPPTNAADPVLEAANPQLRTDIAFRVIADHLRCLTFALTDGAVPSNEGRGYVLRRILRRAVRFGRQNLNLHEPFLYSLVPVVVQTMGDMFPELKKNPRQIIDIIKEEELSFIKTLDRGIELFEEAAGRSQPPPPVARSQKGEISAEDAFKLYDTYGFPIDLTRIMAEERGMGVDLAGYDKLMEEAKDRSRAADKGVGNPVYDLPPGILDELHKLNVQPTDDSQKYSRATAQATVRGIWTGRYLEQYVDVSDTRPNEPVAIILDKTNFYAEMGGQIGDSGELCSNSHIVFIVETTRIIGGYVLHIGHLKSGRLAVTDSVTAHVMGGRERIEKNHTATHMANWALRQALGDHVTQKGSLVDADKLRFDFQHPKAMSDTEIAQVEKLVNTCIDRKLPVYAEVAPQEKALKIHSLRAIFGERYPPMVRVVTIGVPLGDLLANPNNTDWKNYSIEFCGGTHLANSADAERFVITSEESVSKGVRRFVALTGSVAKESLTQAQVIDSLLASSRTVPGANIPLQISAIQKAISCSTPPPPLLAKRRAQAAIAELQDRHKKWQRSSAEKAGGGSDSALKFDPESLLSGAQSINGITLIVGRVPDANADTLRSVWDWLKKKHPQQNLAVLLASEFVDTDKDGNKLPAKANLLAAVGDPHIDKIKAGDWIKAVAPVVGGSGGGRPQLAMAGGKEPAKINEALEAARVFAAKKLA